MSPEAESRLETPVCIGIAEGVVGFELEPPLPFSQCAYSTGPPKWLKYDSSVRNFTPGIPGYPTARSIPQQQPTDFITMR